MMKMCLLSLLGLLMVLPPCNARASDRYTARTYYTVTSTPLAVQAQTYQLQVVQTPVVQLQTVQTPVMAVQTVQVPVEVRYRVRTRRVRVPVQMVPVQSYQTYQAYQPQQQSAPPPPATQPPQPPKYDAEPVFGGQDAPPAPVNTQPAASAPAATPMMYYHAPQTERRFLFWRW